ncbi:MAG: hypothetical protein KAR38_03780 [Calditrichia bacterium]|nr:hypothetical protein [Calditrichia bacterium]
MLKEIQNIKQDSDPLIKRWFNDDYFDLIIWEDEDKKIVTFQLCYDKNKNEHAFHWVKGKEMTHHRVDDGDRAGAIKGTPILFPNGKFDSLKILKQFIDSSVEIEKKVSKFIVKKIFEINK